MFKLICFIGLLFVAGAASAAVCPTQPSSIVATAGKLFVCSDEAVTSIVIEKDGVVKSYPMALSPGIVVEVTGFAACATTSLRVHSVNAAGASPWSALIPSTFPPCTAPKMLPAP